MKTTKRRRSLQLAPLCLGLALLAGAGAACAQEGDYYIVDGKRIELVPSDDYEAVEIKPGERGAVEAIARRAESVVLETSDVLDRYRVILLRQKKGASRGAFDRGVGQVNASSAVRADVPVYELDGIDQVLVNEFIVQFASGTSDEQAGAFLREHRARAVPARVAPGRKPLAGRYTVTFPDLKPRQALDTINRFHGDAKVQFAEPNFLRIYPSRPQPPPAPTPAGSPTPPAGTANPASSTPAPSSPNPSPGATPVAMPGAAAGPSPASAPRIPTDGLFPSQWALRNAGAPGVAGADIGAPAAWGVNTGNDQVVIAIIDEGVDVAHEDLAAKIVQPYDATDGDDDQQPNAWDGHGTACAGIASALTDNALGVAGVSWNAKILPVRIAYSNYPGGPWITSNSIIEDGLRTAVDRGAHVLSNSWGGGTPSSAINSAIDHAIANNRVVVFAAGNDSGPVSYPADLSPSKTLITVSATNEWDEFKTTASQDGEAWWGSNFGPQVTLSAPGVHIHTTDISGTNGYVSGNYTDGFNGTSSATPFVAGAAAVLLTLAPTSTPAQIRDRLARNAHDLGPSGFDDQFGHGRLDLLRAIVDGAGQAADHIDLVIQNAGSRLSRGEQTIARATLTSGGSPVSGVNVSFASANPSRASVSATAVTNAQGVAEAQVRGEASWHQMGSIDITATAGGQQASKPVKVPVLPFWAVLLLAAAAFAGLARRGD